MSTHIPVCVLLLHQTHHLVKASATIYWSSVSSRTQRDMAQRVMVCVTGRAISDNLTPILSMCAERIVMYLCHYIHVFI